MKKSSRRFYKEILYRSSIWRINIVHMKDDSFKFEVSEKEIRKFSKTIFIPVSIYNNPREAIRDIKRLKDKVRITEYWF